MCVWAVEETNFLGYWMTPERVKPLQKKIDAGLKMSAAPTNQKPVRACIGAVAILQNYVPSRRNSSLLWGINLNGKSWVKVLSTIQPAGKSWSRKTRYGIHSGTS